MIFVTLGNPTGPATGAPYTEIGYIAGGVQGTVESKIGSLRIQFIAPYSVAQYAAEVKPLLSYSYHSLQFPPILILRLRTPEATASKEGNVICIPVGVAISSIS